MKLKRIAMLLLAALCGCLFAWLDHTAPDKAQRKTEALHSAVTATLDERLPAIAPERYNETHERTVKTREIVREEAETLSRDALSDALNHELVLFRDARHGGRMEVYPKRN